MMKTRFLLAILALGLMLPAAASAQSSGGSQAAAGPAYVQLTTSKGDIILELNRAAAPKTVANFLQYVEDGHYNGTIFHRVIGNFMIQGGGMDKDMKERRTRAPIANEAKNGLKNQRYTVAMARTGDPHSATAQFFINTKDNPGLDFTAENMQGWGYAVFGRVVKGQDVVDAIAKVKTGQLSGHQDVPVMPVIIEKAVVLTDYKPQ